MGYDPHALESDAESPALARGRLGESSGALADSSWPCVRRELVLGGEIERAVDPVEGIRTGCAVAVGMVGESGEQLVVFVEARSPRDDLADDCLRAIQTASGLKADLVLILEPGTLPRPSSGRLRRGESLRRWQAGTLVPPASVTVLKLAGVMGRSTLARWRHA